MNELLKKFEHAVKYLFIPYLALMFLLLCPIEYYVQSPGGLSEVERLVSIEYQTDKKIEGTISTTFVMGIPRPTIFQFLVGYFNPYADLSVLPASYQNYSSSEVTQISYQDKYISVNAAIIVAYLEAQKSDSSIHIAYDYRTMVFGKSSYLSYYDQIAFGDEFVQAVGDDGIVLTSMSDVGVYTTVGQTYDFTFRRQNQETYTLGLLKNPETGLFGVTFKGYYLVDKTQTFPIYHENETAIGGPSGGLLQTLSIYNMLAETDITRGLKIAGTGTIDYNGNVGYIGGVKQKIITAYENRVDVFFIPYLNDVSHDNYLEALNVCEAYQIDPEGWLIPVSHFTDCLDYLESLGDGE